MKNSSPISCAMGSGHFGVFFFPPELSVKVWKPLKEYDFMIKYLWYLGKQVR